MHVLNVNIFLLGSLSFRNGVYTIEGSYEVLNAFIKQNSYIENKINWSLRKTEKSGKYYLAEILSVKSVLLFLWKMHNNKNLTNDINIYIDYIFQHKNLLNTDIFINNSFNMISFDAISMKNEFTYLALKYIFFKKSLYIQSKNDSKNMSQHNPYPQKRKSNMKFRGITRMEFYRTSHFYLF